MAENKSTVFYRIITSSIIQDNKLRIPGKFVRKHGSGLSEVVTLTTPNNCHWQVRLMKTDEKIFFVNGWCDFVEFQAISASYVLIFMYTGNSKFNVNLFNLSSADITYQCKPPNSLLNPCFQSSFEKVENGKSDPSPKVIKREHIEISNISMIKSQARDDHDSEIKYSYDEIMAYAYEDRSNSLSQGHESTKRRKLGNESDVPKVTCILESPKEEENVLNGSKMSQSENPFCEVILRRSYVYDKATCLYFPSSFAEKYLDGLSGLITLQLSSGKKWLVRFMWRNGLAKLCRGWREFVKGNRLKEGDLCVFELIKKEDIVLKVTIRCSSENAKRV